MKRLILLRHAQAVAKTQADFERTLSREGRAEMTRVAAYLPRQAGRPDLALVSPAARTRETWDLARAGLGAVAVVYDDRLYEGDAAALLAVLGEKAGEAGTVIVVGHNPFIHELACDLVGGGGGAALAPPADFPTAGIAVIDCDVASWADVAPGGGRLVSFAAPDAMG